MKNIEKYILQFGSDPAIAGTSEKMIRNIIKAWTETGKEFPEIRPNLPKKDKEILVKLISDCIKEKGGEISRQAKIISVALIYLNLSLHGKERFLEMLAHDFDVDIEILDENIHKLKDAVNDEELINAEILLRDSLIPPRVKLMRQLITLPNGLIFLKDMRSDLLSIKSAPRLKKLSDDLKALLITYFDVNLLDLQEITWNSPAVLLERLMEYEAVHEISSWKALKHRLQTDHRVFAFTHYRMPNDPLIFVEVALVKGLADNIIKLIDVKVKAGDPNKMDTAIFYSISSTQKGLEGISFGNFLIKRVVKKLSAEYPNLKTFATLSPIPQFRNWLTIYLQKGNDPMFKQNEEERICALPGNKNPAIKLLDILNKKDWHLNEEIVDCIKKPLMRLCLHYLSNAKRGKSIFAYDPVANFHLSNGAKIEKIHWLADSSKKGMAQSAGIMLNYHYRPDKIELNHENYMSNGSIHISIKERALWS
jgi:malonyl-CoA decarboxylase